jgi:hypothetical protein
MRPRPHLVVLGVADAVADGAEPLVEGEADVAWAAGR